MADKVPDEMRTFSTVGASENSETHQQGSRNGISNGVNGQRSEGVEDSLPAKKPKMNGENCTEKENATTESLEAIKLGGNGDITKHEPGNGSTMRDDGDQSENTELIPVRSVKDLEAVCPTKDKTLSYYLNCGKVPQICTEKECILGIDEAGRGPVLGPMVYGIAYVPKEFESDLKDTGCNDSKALTETKRETIFDKLCDLSDRIGWEVDVISPTYISNCMLRRQKYSLNEISHNAAITLVQRALSGGAKISEIYVDTVGPAEKYQDKLQGIFTAQKVTVRSKADAIFPVVGAASIVAKVTRDVAIRGWTMAKREPSEGSDEPAAEPWGSGYPNDPVTKAFLTNSMDPVFGFDDIVRFSWSTADKILEEHAVAVEWEDEEMSSKAKGVPKIKSFFSSVDLTGKERHRFFKERHLTSVTDF